MFWLTSETATWLMMFRAAEFKNVGVFFVGVQGAKPMSVGRLGSMSVQEFAKTAVATPLVVV